MVLFDPLRSAEPPISWGKILEIVSIAADEHCLVAILGFESKYFIFSFLIKSSRSFVFESIYIFFKADFILGFFLFNVSNHFFSNSTPFSPISLQAVKIALGISNGSLFHLSFFLTKVISLSPSGEPWEEAFPDLFGDPNPIIVLHDIIVGLFALDALVIAFEICFSLWPLISKKFHP